MIIALTGHKGSGKDTVADIIIDIESSFNKISFADLIKDQIKHIFNLSSVDDYDKFKRGNFISDNGIKVDGRRIVREIGMLMRQYDSNQFTNYVRDKIKDVSRGWVITDLRFDNEYTFLKSNPSCIIIKVVNKNVPHDIHISERGFDDDMCDFVIENNSDKDELREKVINIMKDIYDYKS